MKSKPVYVFLLVMRVLSIFGALAGALVLLLTLFSHTLFNDPGASSNAPVVALFISMVSFPVICLVSIVLAWRAYGSNWCKVACAVALLPLVNVLAFLFLLQGPAWTGQHFEKTNGEWSWVVRTGGGAKVTPLGADNATFEIMPLGFGDRPDGKFGIVHSANGDFAKDKSRVFFRNQVIPHADPATFAAFQGPYFKDKARVYCGTVPMQVANPDAFEVVNWEGIWTTISAKDALVHSYGESFADLPISAESPAFVGAAWARDGTAYYYGPARVEGADYPTFMVINSHSAKDAKCEYRGPFPRKN